MNKKWKRNTVVAVTAVLVCAAAGLNWRYTNTDAELPQDAKETGTKILGEATLVSDEQKEPTDMAQPHEGTDYFASARLTRQQARDAALSLLQEAAEQENAGQTAVDEASEGIQVLASYTLKEAQIENLVTAKGYQDCVAFMGEDSISVVVAVEQGELTGEDVAKIKDITMAESGYSAGNIKIMAAN